MRIIEPGHIYELQHFVDNTNHETLTFLKKSPVAPDSTELGLDHDGTTNEEVLAVLIDRLQSGNTKVPSRETAIAITKIQEALMWLNARTADRVARGVEGTQQK